MSTDDVSTSAAGSPAGPAAAADHRLRRRQRLLLPLGTLGIGLAASLGIWYAALQSVHRLERQQFDTLALRAERAVAQRMNLYVYGLNGARGVIVASDRVSRAEWRRYVTSRDLPKEFPGALGFGFIERVPRARLGAFVAEARADGAAAFEVRGVRTGTAAAASSRASSAREPAPGASSSAPGASAHDDLLVTKYIEPLAENAAALGFDIGSDAARRAAAERAMLTGEPALTAKIELVQDNRARPGALFLVPVYRRGAPLLTEQDRRDAIEGWVFAPVIAERTLKDVTTAYFANTIDIEIFDVPEPRAEARVFHAAEHVGGALSVRPTYEASSVLTVGGRPWTMIVRTRPEFDAGCDRTGTTGVLVGCVLFSVLVSVVVYFLRGAQMRAAALAEQMTLELRDAKRVAESASSAKSGFIANMSHEIRTPMTAIIGYADLMTNAQQPAEERAQCLTGIRRNGRHLLELINDMLDLSRIEAGKLATERVDCDLPQLISDVAAMMRPRAVEKGLKFNVTFDGPCPPRVRTDPLRLKQIVVNLLGNAVKFTEAGFVTLLVACDGPGEQCTVRLTVSDSGIGMSPEVLSRLFQPFEQADPSTTRRFGGSGLGLAISLRLARLLGGGIVGQSVAGQGSTFTVTFDAGPVNDGQLIAGLSEPASVAQSAIFKGGAAATAAPLAGMHVLLAEDGIDNQTIITHYLRRAGAEVALAVNGRLAVERALGGSFAAVLMDMQMPEVDGYTAASELRRRGYGVPILALTANAMREDRERCLAAGCSEYLPKPIDRELLIRTLLRLTRMGAASAAA